MDIENYKGYAPAVVRIAISLVFLWFGLNQLFDTQSWLGWLPAWTYSLPVSGEVLIMMNGLLETVLGGLLLVGYFTRLAALVLSLHLIGISFQLGYNDVAIRDLGLGLVTFGVFLQGPDRFCSQKPEANQ